MCGLHIPHCGPYAFHPERPAQVPTDPNAALFRDPDAIALDSAAVALAAACAHLSAVAAEAAEVQWAPAPIPRPREDTTERAKGGHGDPTPSVALDTRRADVRAAVVAAARALEFARVNAIVQARTVEDALARWAGE